MSKIDNFNTVTLAAIAILNAVITVLTFQVQQKLEGFKNNLQTAELIGKLTNDLQSPNLKKDIALIALNRTVADNDEKSKQMVAEIATQIYRQRFKELLSDQNLNDKNQDYIGTSEFQDTFVALSIVGERNPMQSKRINEQLLLFKKKYKNQPNKQDVIQSLLDKVDFTTTIYFNSKSTSEENEIAKKEIENFTKYIIKESKNKYVTDLSLIEENRIEETYSKNEKGEPVTRIKYFYPEDEGRAKDLERLLQEYLKNHQKTTLLKKDMGRTDLLELISWNAPHGKIEIWFYFPYSEAKSSP